MNKVLVIRPNQPSRSAVTVLEVLFATMVVVVGLIGIASVIPVAARNAQEANSHTSALNLGLAWTDCFIARGLHRPNPSPQSAELFWVWKRDLGSSPGWSVCNVAQFSNTPTDARLGSNGHPVAWSQLSFCIDPNLPANSQPSGIFRPSVFPYFDDFYNPLTHVIDNNIPLQPRMLRVSLANAQSGSLPISPELVKGIFRSVDDVVVDDSSDPAADPNLEGPTSSSLPARRLFSRSTSTPDFALRSTMNSQFSWIATVSPIGGTTGIFESALVSFVILDRHDHFAPDFTAVPSTDRGERVVSITPLSGPFVGGTGGRVTLSAHTDINDQVHIGDWIMLGTMVPNPLAASRYPVFRWYRIIGAASDPSVSGDYWTREVVLEGPDFPVDTTTSGVLMGGVVTVVERQVKLY